MPSLGNAFRQEAFLTPEWHAGLSVQDDAVAALPPLMIAERLGGKLLISIW